MARDGQKNNSGPPGSWRRSQMRTDNGAIPVIPNRPQSSTVGTHLRRGMMLFQASDERLRWAK